MFCGIGIGKSNAFVPLGQHHDAAVAERSFHRVGAAQQCGLPLHLALHLLCKCFRVAHEQGLAVRSVFRLRQHIRRHEAGPCRFVRHHQYLARAGRHIDGHRLLHQLFRLGHVAVARTEDFVHARYAFRAVGHGRHRLCPTDAEHAVDAAQPGGAENFRGDLSAPSLRRAENDFGATRNLGREGQHEHSGKERCSAARDVEAHALQRHGVLLAHHARLCFHTYRLRLLCGMEGADVVRRLLHGPLHFRLHGQFRRSQLFGCHFQPVELCPVELQGILI